jgi:hypothetical protein
MSALIVIPCVHHSGYAENPAVVYQSANRLPGAMHRGGVASGPGRYANLESAEHQVIDNSGRLERICPRPPPLDSMLAQYSQVPVKAA